MNRKLILGLGLALTITSCSTSNSFHKVAVQRKAAKHLEKMRAHPLEEAGQTSFLTEIIPFELLWEYITGLLDNDFH